ncbi:hypothetical protein [Flavobacterium sp. HJJ]|uniref:hypothetical protein n=1 Tax=Flavobacterium sp. HJJ TaxID=2783792 RepID=UPI00188C2DA4|nr:hypothetical protein [Flavobacterium sp. HJJ]MBF4470685.1 hypothetical protein [Flavobacterium sp. HJJ]
MKKAVLTIGLFTLVLVSTSFTSPQNSTTVIDDSSVITSIDGTGGQSSGDNRKVDYTGASLKNQIVEIDGTGGQSSGDNRKVD